MSKKNYNINLQDSSYYISLNIIKKKQQQHQQQQNQLANGFFKPARSTTPNKTFFKTSSSSTSSTTKSPYDECLTRKKDTNEKNLRERLKLVNEISNLNSRKQPQYHHHNLFTQNPKPSQCTNSHATVKTEFEKKTIPTRSSTIYSSKPNKNYKTNLNLNLKTNYKLSPNNKFNIEIASPVNKSNCFLFEKPKHSPYTYYSHTPNSTKHNNSHHRKESLFFKRSISATDDYDVYERYANIVNKNTKNKKPSANSFDPSHMKEQQHQYMSSFSLEKPSCIGEEETITSLIKDSSMSILSRNGTLGLSSSRTVSSFDLDKLSVNKFLMLDSRKGNKKSSEISKLLFSKPTAKRRDSLKPLNSANETSQMSSIRSMGSNELDLYIDSLIRKFRLRSNLANASTAATMTSSAEAGSSVNSNSNKSTNNDADSSLVNSEQQQQPQSKQIYINNPTIKENNEEEEEEEEENDNDDIDDGDGDGEEDSTFINYTHSYELEDLNDDTQQMNLADEDLSFDNENTSN